MTCHLVNEPYGRPRVRSLDSMEGLTTLPETSTSVRGALRERLYRLYPGALAAGTTGIAATWLAQHYGAPVMLFALLFGMASHFLHDVDRCRWGIDFCSKTVLRTGVALLGTRVTFDKIVELGAMPILAVMVGVATTILFGLVGAMALGMRSGFGLLSGGAVGICGASAALAIASVLPPSDERERDTIFTVVVVTALSTLALTGIDHVRAGIFLGGTIHDVAQVVGASYGVSPETGDVATYVKLLRVAMLLPVVFTIAIVMRYRPAGFEGAAKAPLPMFLIGFGVLVVAGSLGWFPPRAVESISDFSRWCLVTAIAGLGMKTSFKNLIDVGPKPVILVVSETLWIAGFMISIVMVSR